MLQNLLLCIHDCNRWQNKEFCASPYCRNIASHHVFFFRNIYLITYLTTQHSYLTPAQTETKIYRIMRSADFFPFPLDNFSPSLLSLSLLVVLDTAVVVAESLKACYRFC